MAKRRKKRKQKAGVSQRVSQRQVTVIHVGDQKSKRRKKVRRKRTGAASAAEAATAAISASMGRPVDLGLMDPQLQQVLDAHNTMNTHTMNTCTDTVFIFVFSTGPSRGRLFF